MKLCKKLFGWGLMQDNPNYIQTISPKEAKKKNNQLFPFGFGLTYTSFEYSDLDMAKSTVSTGESIEIKATITNTGQRFGEEVVQLYVWDVAASVARPVRELKGFQKIGLEPGSSKEVSFTLNTDDLIYFGADRRWGIDPGILKVWIGPNAAEGLESSFEIVEK